MKNELKEMYNKYFKNVPPDMIHEAFDLVYVYKYNDGPDSTINYYVFLDEHTYYIEYLETDKSFVSFTSIPNARVYAAIINNEYDDDDVDSSCYYYQSRPVKYNIFVTEICNMIHSNIFNSIKCPYCGVTLRNVIAKECICGHCGRHINYEDEKTKIVNQFLASYNGPEDIEIYSISSEKEEKIDRVADDARVTFEDTEMNKDTFISLLHKLDCFYIEAFNRIDNRYKIYIKTIDRDATICYIFTKEKVFDKQVIILSNFKSIVNEIVRDSIIDSKYIDIVQHIGSRYFHLG